MAAANSVLIITIRQLKGKFYSRRFGRHIHIHCLYCRYYERLADVQARGSQTTHNVLRDILREVQSSMVPNTLLKDWATRNFRSATDYWQFRKMVRLLNELHRDGDLIKILIFSLHYNYLWHVCANMLFT